MNQLYFGDNLQVLKDHIKDESVDLIYLDPPFNSKRDYNLLFKSPPKVGRASPRAGSSGASPHQGGEDYSSAQITAFEDSWHWGEQAEREFDELVHAPNTDVSEMMQALRRFLGENDMMAYLTMMANRLLQLHRVLKPTGSLYLHCDPTASHFLKIVLDGVFGKLNFKNEIIWPRTNAHNIASKHFSRVHDVIFFYSKTDDYKWNPAYVEFSPQQLDRYSLDEETGRMVTGQDLTMTGNPDRNFEWRGTRPASNRGWGLSLEELEKLWEAGMILKKKDGTPRLDGRKVFLDEKKGKPTSDIWMEIERIGNTSGERLGYDTQKPLALLERIIAASSNEGDVVLDPFCGCGTAVHAAQKLNRQWIGIDITHLAISLIEKRLKDAFGAIASGSATVPVASAGVPPAESARKDASGEDAGRCGRDARAPQSKLEYEVHGTPKDLDAARDLATRDKYQFQWWAVSLVEAQPFQGKKKGADGGIDGVKFFHDVDKAGARKIVVSVKGGGLKADDVRALEMVREREGAEIALFISLEEPTRGMIADAASAGFYESATGKKFPRVQLLTIEGLLSGQQRAEHPDHAPDLNFKKAKAESNAAQKDLI